VDENRIGDHICYISDLRKMKSHFPAWDITHSLSNILEEMIAAEANRLALTA
jgi:CDP-paratose 2-epimerase